MAAVMFPIPVTGPGRLWIMPCPDGAVLAQKIAEYRKAGVTDVVSMLAVDEAEMLGVGQEAALCRAEGIIFHSHPIPDFGLPEMDSFTALTHQIAGWLRTGQGVAVHCRAGIGRSGMVTAGVLITQGHSARNAMDQVSTARGVSIPDTVEQGNFLSSCADFETG